jgi:oligopeptide/dipeptide ABC transporter ATP-binding protein
MTEREPELLTVSDLKMHFPFGSRWFGERGWVRAVDGVNLHLHRGEVLGLVGESGSGKSTLARAILNLLEPTSGGVLFDGIDVLGLQGDERKTIRRRMQIIFQNPYAALSPRMQIQQIIAEPLRLHGLAAKTEIKDRVAALLGEVGLESYFMNRYPHEMSGGQRQRITIARALALKPDLIVADEPVSALDVSVQAQILNILIGLQRQKGIGMLFISHDLSVVEKIADRVAVMYLGKIVEESETDRLIDSPQHPYTQALVSSVPEPDPTAQHKRIHLTGEFPSPAEPITGCPFASRCPEVRETCRSLAPPLEHKTSGHLVACHLRE